MRMPDLAHNLGFAVWSRRDRGMIQDQCKEMWALACGGSTRPGSKKSQAQGRLRR